MLLAYFSALALFVYIYVYSEEHMQVTLLPGVEQSMFRYP